MIGIFSPLYFLVRSLTGGSQKQTDSLMEKAYDHKKTGNFRLAAETYTKAIETGTNTWVAYFYRGECRMLSGDAAGAIADFEKAIEISPRYSQKAKEALEKAKAVM